MLLPVCFFFRSVVWLWKVFFINIWLKKLQRLHRFFLFANMSKGLILLKKHSLDFYFWLPLLIGRMPWAAGALLDFFRKTLRQFFDFLDLFCSRFLLAECHEQRELCPIFDFCPKNLHEILCEILLSIPHQLGWVLLNWRFMHTTDWLISYYLFTN